MGQVLRKLLEVFYTKKLDIVVIGLENRSVKMLLFCEECKEAMAAERRWLQKGDGCRAGKSRPD